MDRTSVASVALSRVLRLNGRAILGTTAAAVFAACAGQSPSAAQGGYSQPEYRHSGTTTLQSKAPTGQTSYGVIPWESATTVSVFDPATGGMTSRQVFYTIMPSFSGDLHPGHELYANNNGSIRAKFTWQGSGTPPDTVYVLENSTVKWLADAPASSGSVSAGGGGTKTQTVYQDRLIGETIQRKRLVQQKGGSTIEVTSPTLSASARGVWPSNYGYVPLNPHWQGYGRVEASCQYSAAIDNRGVSITSPAIEEGRNWRKGANGEKVENVRNDDGSMTVDSVAPWIVESVSSSAADFAELRKGWRLGTGLQTLVSGFPKDSTSTFDFDHLAIRVDWSNTGDGTVSNGFSDKWSTNLTSELLPKDNPPKSTTVRVVVTDGRSGMEATAENTYTINWHTPYENWSRDGEPKTEYQDVRARVTAGLGAGSSDIEIMYIKPKPYVGTWTKDEVSKAVTFLGAASIPVPLYDFVFKALLGIMPDLFGEEEEKYLMERNRILNGRDPLQYKLESVQIYAVNKRYPYLGDAYGVNGYQGRIARHYTSVFQDLDIIPNWALNEPTPPDVTPGG